MNLRLFLFLLYVLPGRSKEDVVSRFPRNRKNSLIYDVDSDFTYRDGSVYRLNSNGEKKLRGFFIAIGGFITFLITVIGAIVA